MSSGISSKKVKQVKRAQETVSVLLNEGPQHILSVLGNGIIFAFRRIKRADVLEAALDKLITGQPEKYGTLIEDINAAIETMAPKTEEPSVQYEVALKDEPAPAEAVPEAVSAE